MAEEVCIIHMRNVPGTDAGRALDVPLECLMMDGTTVMIPVDFFWDGNSTPFLVRPLFPRHNHPIASCRHDYRCGKARNATERKFADEQFQIDVGTTGWWITKKVGYYGVRIGALFGIGSDFEESNMLIAPDLEEQEYKDKFLNNP